MKASPVYGSICKYLFGRVFLPETQDLIPHLADHALRSDDLQPVPDRSFLTDTIRVPFWGKMLPVPREYDRYLTMRYGDYMTPPPKEKQRPTHNIKGIKL